MGGHYVKNAWDVHVHVSPSLFEREADAASTVKLCRDAGMSGAVLKAHHGSTVEAASVLNNAHQDFFVYGGLVLNQFCGGLNPLAVEASINLGARIIWLPTIHAQAHKDKIGLVGGFSFQKSSQFNSAIEPISITGETGALKSEMREILNILQNTDTVLATGHISANEIEALISFVKKNKIKVKLLVSHVFFQVPGFKENNLPELKNENIWLEVSNFSVISGAGSLSAEGVAAAIKKYPELNWIMSSDSGQKSNPLSPEALNSFSEALIQNEVSERQISKMLNAEPRRLLGF